MHFSQEKKNIELLPIMSAGQQEQGIRGGTSNAPVNTMLAKTLRIALEEQPKAMFIFVSCKH